MSDDTARRERAEKLTEQVASLLHELWSKWFLHQYQNATNENVRRWMAQAGTTYWGLSESDKDKDRKLAQPLVEMILAVAREEAAIWEPELKATINEFIGDAASRHQEIEKLRAEIAALRADLKWSRSREEFTINREAELRVEWADQRAEIAALREFVRWHFMHHPQSWPGNAEIMPAVRRALEETP